MDWKRIVLTIISLILVIFLAVLLINMQRKDNEQAAELERLAMEERQATLEIRKTGEEIYNTLLQATRDSLEGIVCWGDESMAGNRYSSLSANLESVINEEIFGSIVNDLIRRAKYADARGLHFDAVNMGVVEEDFHEILTRTGALQLVLKEGFTIPSGTDRIDVEMADPDGNSMRYAVQQYARFGETRIAGVIGRLYNGSGYYDSTHPMLAFGRDFAGSEKTVPAGTPVYTEGAEKYRAYIPVLFFAENEDVTTDEFIAGINDILSIYGNGTYVLICTTKQGSAWDLALTASYGKRYLRNELPVANMKKEDYLQLAEAVYENLKAQGLFDEVIRAVETAHAELDEKLAEE